MYNFTKTLTLFLLIVIPAFLQAQLPTLNSYPTASATLYLDFDGHNVQVASWNNGNAFYCQPAAVTNTQVEEIFHRVAEDFRPFDINITTDSSKFIAAPLDRRMRIVVTPSSSWYPGNVGGVSYVGSFTWGNNTPGFVFSDKLGNNAKYLAECITHESGHTVGLSHQSKYDQSCNMLEQYHVGSGSGETSWAPVMGNSYYRNMTGWNDGPTPFGCANTQDNLTIITSSNGFGYRADDYADEPGSTAFNLGAAAFSANGVITQNADKDAFKFVLAQNANFHLQAKPFSLGANSGANLDVAVDLYKDAMLVRTYNPGALLSVDVDTLLSAGTYYFVVSGSGNDNTNDYGSIGSYSVIGFFGALAIKEIKLSGNAEKNKHQLNWTVAADEPTIEQEIEVSTNGINFKPLATINTTQKSFSYSTNQSSTLYYRVKIKTVINETAYSNVVALQSGSATYKPFTVSTLIQQDIAVNAPDNFSYLISDANGRLLIQGLGKKGMQKINAGRLPGGMYILQLVSNNERQTERIIKQ
ncbi:MAG: T9SS type A sorting domain-containing protein [Chitinophagaceae bacterium]|nr:MAG: T9SS type A sorting domain-containing protein [Chitinophagaceae bacterium]